MLYMQRSNENQVFNLINMFRCCLYLLQERIMSEISSKHPARALPPWNCNVPMTSLTNTDSDNQVSYMTHQRNQYCQLARCIRGETKCCYLSVLCTFLLVFHYFQNNGRDLFCFRLQCCKRRNAEPSCTIRGGKYPRSKLSRYCSR